jgi:hypothetical protein
MFENGSVQLNFSDKQFIQNSNNQLTQNNDMNLEFFKKKFYFTNPPMDIQNIHQFDLIPVFKLTKQYLKLQKQSRKELNKNLLDLINVEVILIDFLPEPKMLQKLRKYFEEPKKLQSLQLIKFKSNGCIFEVNEVDNAILDSLRILIGFYVHTSLTVIINEDTNSLPPDYLKKLFFILNPLKRNVIMEISNSKDPFQWFTPCQIYHLRRTSKFFEKSKAYRNVSLDIKSFLKEIRTPFKILSGEIGKLDLIPDTSSWKSFDLAQVSKKEYPLEPEDLEILLDFLKGSFEE